MKKLVPLAALLLGLTLAAAELKSPTSSIVATSSSIVPPPCWPFVCH
jgi:hypothetical protein